MKPESQKADLIKYQSMKYKTLLPIMNVDKGISSDEMKNFDMEES